LTGAGCPSRTPTPTAPSARPTTKPAITTDASNRPAVFMSRPPPTPGPRQPPGAAAHYNNAVRLAKTVSPPEEVPRGPHRPPAPRPYDDWCASDAAARRLKYQHLSEALLKMNGGRGPDILAVAEVESLRAAELLKDALNDGLRGRAPAYDNVVMKEVNG